MWSNSPLSRGFWCKFFLCNFSSFYRVPLSISHQMIGQVMCASVHTWNQILGSKELTHKWADWWSWTDTWQLEEVHFFRIRNIELNMQAYTCSLTHCGCANSHTLVGSFAWNADDSHPSSLLLLVHIQYCMYSTSPIIFNPILND